MAGNWKMYKSVAETVEYFEKFRPLVAGVTHCEVVIAPPFPALAVAVEMTRGTPIRIGAQNLHWQEQGAYTGEVCGSMLKACGCTHVIIGHSERRQYFAETDEWIAKKLRAALAEGLHPIVCVGETLQEREGGKTSEVVSRQVRGALGGLDGAAVKLVTLAYEPVWAIGTGRTATTAQAQEVHAQIRALLRELGGVAVAGAVRIQYGGSVKPDNARDLLSQPDVDGALVGGASLKAADFASIVSAAD